MKLIATALLFVAFNSAGKALYADPVSPDVTQPLGADYRIDGGAWLPCALSGTPLQMVCNLDSLTKPGRYVLSARYVYKEGEAISEDYVYTIPSAGGAVASTYKIDAPQKDGSRYVIEVHTDAAGKQHQIGPYLVPGNFNVDARMKANADALVTRLADDEAEQATQVVKALSLVHQTPEEFAGRYWTKVQDAFQRGDKIEYSRLIWWLAQRIVAGDITDAQARATFNTAFGRSLTAAQWTTLKTTRLIPARDRYQAMLDEAAL